MREHEGATHMSKHFVPNEEQQPVIAASPDQGIFVQAGAGSGKTATLVARMVSKLSEEGEDGKPQVQSIDRCLMGTFTEPAAAEFKERTRSYLNDQGHYDQAAKVDNSYISTIHATCRRVLSDNALDLGLDPEFEVMTQESRQTRAQREAVERAMDKISRSEEFSQLIGEYDLTKDGYDGNEDPSSIQGMLTNIVTTIMLYPEGVDSLHAPEGNHESLMAIAEAFGKQLGETDACIQEDVSARTRPTDAQVRRAEASERIARDGKEVVEGVRGVDIHDITDMTRLCHDIERLSVEPNRSLISTRGLRGDMKSQIDLLNARYTHLRAEAQLLRVGILYDWLVAIAEDAIREGDREKDDAGTLDLNDLLRRTYDALTDKDSEVARGCKDKFDLAMIDEFQDTSPQQASIIRALAAASDIELDNESDDSITMVGDIQQSIYRFRGANVHYVRKERDAAEQSPERLLATMNTNYRSHGDIVDAVKAICDDGGRGNGILSDFVPAKTDDQRDDGVFTGLDVPRFRLDVGRYDWDPSFGPTLPEARAASADRIADMFARYSDWCKRKGVHKTMALLLGSMTNVETYAQALESRGVPYAISGGSVFSKRPEVRTIADLLRVIADLGNTVALWRLLASDMFLLGDDDFLALHAKAGKDGKPVAQGLDEGILSGDWAVPPSDPRLLEHARGVIMQAIEEAGTLPLSAVCENAVRRSGWLERLAEQGGRGQMAAANVMSAIRHVREIVDDAGLGPVSGEKAFTEWLREAKEPPAVLAGHEDAIVQIQTIHASKGLEFSCVAVAECNRDPRIEYRGLAIVPDKEGARASLTPSERNRLDWVQYSHGAQNHAQSALLLKLRDALGVLGDDVPAGVATKTLEWREEGQQDEIDEKARLLYVGLTRAQDFLMLSVLAKYASKSAKSAGQCITPNLMDRVIHGIDAVNEDLADDGRSVEPLVYDRGTANARLRIGENMRIRLGKDSFGLCTISEDRGSQASGRERPERVSIYEDATDAAHTAVKVDFVVSQDRED